MAPNEVPEAVIHTWAIIFPQITNTFWSMLASRALFPHHNVCFHHGRSGERVPYLCTKIKHCQSAKGTMDPGVNCFNKSAIQKSSSPSIRLIISHHTNPPHIAVIVLVDEENLIKLWLRLVWLQNSCVFETFFI